jgi:dTDP-4-amino-4,6-dideoxygalactose transaminase
MSNGTVALEIASKALGLVGEVITPAFTFIATAHALLWQGIRPVFCDIDPVTHHLDPKLVEGLINHRTSGILGVHLWGRACDVDALAEIADRHGIPLLFDACHALGVEHGGRSVGGFGRCEVFSFHATKYLNTLEGGAVVTDDPQLAEKMRFMRNFGFCGEDCVSHLGTNGKMNEVSAVMGLLLLEDVDGLVATNKSIYEAYVRSLDGLSGLAILPYPSGGRFNYQHVVVMVDEVKAGLTRDELVAVLRAENVLARRYFYPGCHRMKPYSAMHEYAGLHLPVTDDVAARVIVLPTGRQLGENGAARIGSLLRLALRTGVPAV